jgi:hypothetical protein
MNLLTGWDSLNRDSTIIGNKGSELEEEEETRARMVTEYTLNAF